MNEVEVTVQDSDSDVDTAPVIGGIAGGIFVFLMILAAVIAAVVLYKRQRRELLNDKNFLLKACVVGNTYCFLDYSLTPTILPNFSATIQ